MNRVMSTNRALPGWCGGGLYCSKKVAMKSTLLSTALLIFATLSFAQTSDYSKDVASVDAIINAVYDVISGEPGTSRDWARFRNLFKPETRLLPTRKNAE